MRRRHLIAGAASTVLSPAFAQKQTRTVKILVGFPAGQATDQIARTMADRLGDTTGNTYIVENRPGQGGSLALGELARSPADGSVMMLAHMSALCTNPHLYKRVAYDALKDFEAVGLVADIPFVLVCLASLPFRNAQDVVNYAKAHPSALSNASSGNGTVSHLAMEEFKRRAGVAILHVPYKGSVPGLTDVSAGSVTLALETATSVLPLIETGRIRPLAAGTSRRLSGPLNVPTFEEQGFKDFTASTWLMVLYPRGVDKTFIKQQFDAMMVAMKNPAMEQKLATANVLPRYSADPDSAMGYLRSEYAKWGEVVKRSGVSLES